MRGILSISIEQNLVDLVDDHVKEQGINRSLFVREAIRAALGTKNLMPKIHTSTDKVRAMREDGKCNPMLRPKCMVCHGGEEE